jgi:hypothetical protein
MVRKRSTHHHVLLAGYKGSRGLKRIKFEENGRVKNCHVVAVHWFKVGIDHVEYITVET